MPSKSFRVARIERVVLSELVSRGMYLNESDAIRDAIRSLGKRHGIVPTVQDGSA